MGLRILLVSVVAGLGLTLPTGKQVGEWHGSARAWVETRLADWDAQVLEEGDAYVVSSEPVPAPVAARATEATAPVVASATVTAAPAAVAAPAPAPAPVPAVTPADLTAALVVAADFNDADLDFAPDAAPAPTAAVPTETVVNSDAPFEAAEGDFITAFVAEQVAAIAATIAAAPPQVAAPTVENPDAAFAAAQEEFVTGFVAEQAAAIAAAEKAGATPAPGLALVETADDNGGDLYEGLAYALNRGAEGLEPLPVASAERAGEVKASDRDGRLTNAVRLTRDAVYAWANLLHGPAVVTIGH